jgi:hypothetical protein
MTIGNCSECSKAWPGCGAATNCFIGKYWDEDNSDYDFKPMEGCASHFQPRQDANDKCQKCHWVESCNRLYRHDGCTNGSSFQPRQERSCGTCGHFTGPGNECLSDRGDDVKLFAGYPDKGYPGNDGKGNNRPCLNFGLKVDRWIPRPVSGDDQPRPVVEEKTWCQGVIGDMPIADCEKLIETDERVVKGDNPARWFEDRPGIYSCMEKESSCGSDGIVTTLRGLLAVVEEMKRDAAHKEAGFKRLQENYLAAIKDYQQARDGRYLIVQTLHAMSKESQEFKQERDAALARVKKLEEALKDRVGCGSVCELVALERNVSARLRAEVEEINAKRDKLEAEVAKPKGKTVRAWVSESTAQGFKEGYVHPSVTFSHTRYDQWVAPVTITVEEE